MSFEPNISVMALVQVLRQLRISQTQHVNMPSLEKAWVETGLRQSDLPVCIQDLETAGFITVAGDGAGEYVVLTEDSSARLALERFPEIGHVSWIDHATLYWIKHRKRQKDLGARRRRTDQVNGRF